MGLGSTINARGEQLLSDVHLREAMLDRPSIGVLLTDPRNSAARTSLPMSKIQMSLHECIPLHSIASLVGELTNERYSQLA